MDIHKFSGNDPILVFEFQPRIIEETDNVLMSEDQSHIILPHSSLTLYQLSSDQFRLAPVIVELLVGLKRSSFSYKRLQHWSLPVTLAIMFRLCNSCPRKRKLKTLPALTNPCTDVLTFVHDEVEKMIFSSMAFTLWHSQSLHAIVKVNRVGP